MNFRTVRVLCLVLSLGGNLPAQTIDRFSPQNGATMVRNPPVLGWVFDARNLLSNGGFEQGMDGWAAYGMRPRVRSSTGAPEGTNIFAMLKGSLSCRVDLPQNAGAISLSFVQWRTPLRVRVESPEGELLRDLSPAFDSETFTGAGWINRMFDLTRFAGRSVVLVWLATEYYDNIDKLIDDVRVVVSPPGICFDVYMTRWNPADPSDQPLALLGRTYGCSWPVQTPPYRDYYRWRVDTITHGKTNAGPILWFGVDSSAGPFAVEFSDTPAAACIGEEPQRVLSVINSAGSKEAGVQGSAALYATGNNAPPPAVVISELEMRGGAVEFTNPSTNEVNLANWSLQIFNSRDASDINDLRPTQTLVLPTNAILGPGALFTVRNGLPATSPWPALGPLKPIWWGADHSSVLGAVVLRDNLSKVVDAVFVETPFTNSFKSFQRDTVSLSDWRSPPISFTLGMDFTLQRIGNSDHNRDSDWAMRPGSFGTLNPEMVLPFSPGFGRFKVSPSLTTEFVQGSWTGLVQIPYPGSNIVIEADFSYGKPATHIYGSSQPIDVVGPEACRDLPSVSVALTALRDPYGLGEILLRFKTSPGSIYTVEKTHGFGEPWFPISSSILGSGSQAEFRSALKAETEFFRLRLPR